MRIKNKSSFFIGAGVLVILGLSYFVNISYLDLSGNEINTSLLGILIFYNKFVLIIYLLVALFLIIKGINKRIKIV